MKVPYSYLIIFLMKIEYNLVCNKFQRLITFRGRSLKDITMCCMYNTSVQVQVHCTIHTPQLQQFGRITSI